MESAATESQHKCSCGRTFRHGISLKRHQKVSGCPDAEGSVKIVAIAPVVEAPRPVQCLDDESGSVTITAQQIARWQEQNNFRGSDTPASFSIDWTGVRATAQEFATFTGEQFTTLGRFLGAVGQLTARFTLFSAFVVGLGWLLLFGISQDLSAAPSSDRDRTEAAQLSARSTVISFLQTAQLSQYERARDFLAARTRATVSAADLQTMFANLPLRQSPESVASVLEQDGRVAKVTVVRGGAAEVYTLVLESQGWGLASVAVRRS